MSETRVPAPTEKPVVLTIAGSDSGGGAGVQADLKTIEATGGFGVSALTAVTAQNTTGVESTHVLPVDELEAQLDAVLSDFDVRAVKTGMLATAELVEAVASIPVLTARTSKSSRTASSCASSSPTGRTWVDSTAVVFWAVTAVTAETPNPPVASMVFRSAWMPAPPPESLPATVRTTGFPVGAGVRLSLMPGRTARKH